MCTLKSLGLLPDTPESSPKAGQREEKAPAPGPGPSPVSSWCLPGSYLQSSGSASQQPVPLTRLFADRKSVV